MWRRSSWCAEVAADTSVRVRDSTDPDGAVLAFTPAAWREFTRTVRNG